MLRGKLASSDKDQQDMKNELNELKTVQYGELQANLLRSDAERIVLQRKLHEKEEELEKLSLNVTHLKSSSSIADEMTKTVSTHAGTLEQMLQEEREKNTILQQNLATLRTSSAATSDLQALIDDLQNENEVLKSEQSKLLNARFSHRIFEEHDAETKKLKATILDLKEELDCILNREQDTSSEFARMKDAESINRAEIFQLNARLKSSEENQAAVKHRLEQIIGSGINDAVELEEAITFIKLRKERGLHIDLNMLDEFDKVHDVRPPFKCDLTIRS